MCVLIGVRDIRGDSFLNMSVNRGKDFENKIKEAFMKIHGVSIDRLHDQMTGYKVTSANPCDFIVYKKPYEYYIECKSVHGNTLPFSNITDNQWRGLLEKSKIDGVKAGVICWWIDKDVTLYIPIQTLETLKNLGRKSVRYDEISLDCVIIPGKKKRVFFEYEMEVFFNEV
jgi:penicillin-binding protein-related factor A (putative recombinase)